MLADEQRVRGTECLLTLHTIYAYTVLLVCQMYAEAKLQLGTTSDLTGIAVGQAHHPGSDPQVSALSQSKGGPLGCRQLQTTASTFNELSQLLTGDRFESMQCARS